MLTRKPTQDLCFLGMGEKCARSGGVTQSGRQHCKFDFRSLRSIRSGGGLGVSAQFAIATIPLSSAIEYRDGEEDTQGHSFSDEADAASAEASTAS